VSTPQPLPTPPPGVWITAGFFALSGLLEVGLTLWDSSWSPAFWSTWEALGRASLYGVLAWGLWRRIAICRTVAMVYCLAVLVTYAVVLGMALAGAPVRYPPSVVVQSLYQIPSCALLFPYLRSPRAAKLFPRALFGG